MSKEAGKCVVCNEHPSKYTCPRCELSTCSLNCVTIHKKELNCNGVRDKTGYVSIKKFDNLNLLSDYRFLEDVNRSVDNCRRNPLKRYTRYMQPLPPHLYRLRSAAQRRGIHLQYLPQHFTRHSNNKTMLHYDTQVIHWKIDLIFPQGEMLQISEVFDEKVKLSKVVDKFVNYKTCPDVYKDKLRFYHSCGISDVEVLLKAERVKQHHSFYLLDLFSTVGENLVNHVIIENPIIYVVRKTYKDQYVILDDREIVGNPFEVLHGKKSGFFGDFSPVGLFDELEQQVKKKSKADLAMENIQSIASELRMRDRRDDADCLVSKEDELPILKRDLDIPTYDTLCQRISDI